MIPSEAHAVRLKTFLYTCAQLRYFWDIENRNATKTDHETNSFDRHNNAQWSNKLELATLLVVISSHTATVQVEAEPNSEPGKRNQLQPTKFLRKFFLHFTH